MPWLTELAGKPDDMLDNLEHTKPEQTGAALHNQDIVKSKKQEKPELVHPQETGPQKKRPIVRCLKKATIATETKSSNFVPTKKLSPTSHVTQSRPPDRDSHENNNLRPSRKKTPVGKLNTQFSLNSPKPGFGDMKDSKLDDQFGLKQRGYRQFKLPADLELLSSHDMTYKMQNLEVENTMLKNELNVMNREVSELLDRLRKTENDLCKTHEKLESSINQNQQLNLELKSQSFHLQQLRNKIGEIRKSEITNTEIQKYKEKSDTMEKQISILQNRNEELEDKIKQLTEIRNENNTTQMKLESELRRTKSTIGTLQGNLVNTTKECQIMQKGWEAYKQRVKTMMLAKDNEIAVLEKSVTVAKNTKTLTEELERLKEEREGLSEAVSHVRSECAEMKQDIEQLESRYIAADGVVTALRNALRDERAANKRAEAQYVALGKELQALQIETEKTIGSLHEALRDTDSELHQLRNSVTSIRTDTSALIVDDYDVTHLAIDNDRVHCLPEVLVQNQGQIDSLLADNNMLRIQLEKLERKYEQELSMRSNHNHVMHLQDERQQLHGHVTSLSSLSVRVGVMMRKYPLFRMFTVVYIVSLHFWVLIALYSNAPNAHYASYVKT